MAEAGESPQVVVSDGELVRRAKAGDKSAFDALMERYEREVITVAYRMLGRHEDAVDLAQDTFTRAWRSLSVFREEAAFRTWLYRIALNLVLNRRRWYARHRVSLTVSLDEPADPEGEGDPLSAQMADPAPGPRENAAQSELRSKILAALEQLPVSFRTVVVLRDMKGLSYEEISKICGERAGTVKSRLHRARALLRERLGGGLK